MVLYRNMLTEEETTQEMGLHTQSVPEECGLHLV